MLAHIWHNRLDTIKRFLRSFRKFWDVNPFQFVHCCFMFICCKMVSSGMLMPSADNASLTSGRLHKVAKTLALNPLCASTSTTLKSLPHKDCSYFDYYVHTLQLKEQIFLSVPPFLKFDAHSSLFLLS